jgi:hypothetical protein
VDRIPSLKKNVRSYSGPVSAAVYVQNPEQLEELAMHWKKSRLLRRYVNFHIVHPLKDEFDNPRKNKKLSHSYPINYLRNVARKYAETEYVLYLDCDFVVSESLFDDLTNGKIATIVAEMSISRRTMIVLPGFFCSENPPKTRTELLKQWDLANDLILQPITFDSHKLTRYDIFRNQHGSEFYTPAKVEWSEPYYIAPRSVPLYSERFIGCGMDKLQQNYVAEQVEFTYMIWKKHFICHVPHSISKQPLCDEYPPGAFTFNALSAHFWMLQKETRRGLIDFEDEQKRTVLKNARMMHTHWFARQPKIHTGSGYHLLLIIPMILVCVIAVRWFMHKRQKDDILKL